MKAKNFSEFCEHQNSKTATSVHTVGLLLSKLDIDYNVTIYHAKYRRKIR